MTGTHTRQVMLKSVKTIFLAYFFHAKDMKLLLDIFRSSEKWRDKRFNCSCYSNYYNYSFAAKIKMDKRSEKIHFKAAKPRF